MSNSFLKHPLKFLLFAAVLLPLLLAGCNSQKENKTNAGGDTLSGAPQNESTFDAVNGIRFYEVKRRFKSGLSFNKDGFQQEPSWVIEFKAPDSMLAYSPEIKRMQGFYLMHDHDRVYNFAREYFRAKVISRDSLVLQRLEVNGRIIADDDDARSDVFSTYYTKDYIENKLHTSIETLRRPTRADTLFIQELAKKTYKEPANPSLAFAARQPVVFLPNSSNVTVEKISTIDLLNNRHASVDYLYPLYKLHINKSYKNFSFRFSVIVDAWGKLYVNRVEGVMPEDVVYRKKLLDGITSVYLQNLFIIKPGTTLGIKHSSEVTLQVKGTMSP
jgi:hypothetical protein